MTATKQKDITKDELEGILLDLCVEHDVAIPAFELEDAVSRGGVFKSRIGELGDPLIRLGQYLRKDAEVAEYVLRHEFVHYLQYCDFEDDYEYKRKRKADGPHGSWYDRLARQVDGASANPPYHLKDRYEKLMKERKAETAKYRVYCPECDHESYRQRKSKVVKQAQHYRCSNGHSGLEVEVL